MLSTINEQQEETWLDGSNPPVLNEDEVESKLTAESLAEEASSGENPASADDDIMSHPMQQSATTQTLLSVPHAQDWEPGLEIRDDTGKVYFVVENNACLGETDTGLMLYVATIADPDSLIAVAVIYRGNSCFRDFFWVFTYSPNYDRQSPERRVDGRELFIYAKLTQSPLHKTYTYQLCTGPDEYELIMQAKNAKIRLILIISCAFAIFCAKWNIKFYEPGNDTALVIRDQKEGSLAIAPGVSLLASVCIACAFDRLTKPI